MTDCYEYLSHESCGTASQEMCGWPAMCFRASSIGTNVIQPEIAPGYIL